MRRGKRRRREALISSSFSETDSENCAQLEIDFVRSVRRLREPSQSHKPVLMSEADVRANEEISDSFVVAPLGELEFMQHLDANRYSLRDLVARAERLLQFPLTLLPSRSFPYGFEC